MRGRTPSRSPARAPPIRNSSTHSLSRQLSKSVTDWLSGNDKNRRKDPSLGDDRRSRATERGWDTGRGRRRSVSTATEGSLVSHSRSRSRDRHHRRVAHSSGSTELGSRTSYTSSSHHKSRRSHRQRRRDRSYSSSRSRSSSRERTHREKKKALKTSLLLLGSVAAATMAAQKYWSKDSDHEDREPDIRDSRPGHHRRRGTKEKAREGAERVHDELWGRHEGTKSRQAVTVRHSVEKRDSPRSATSMAGKPDRLASNMDLSNRERLGLNNGAGARITPTSPAPTPASVAPSSMRVEPPRSVYHPHYEETQYTAAPEDDEPIWMPVEERISQNSRGEVVVEMVEQRVGQPSDVAAKRKSHGGRGAGGRDKGNVDMFREVERHKIVDEWDPRWKKY